MSNNPDLTVSSFELDQLKEIMNIGVSHASTALSRIINKRVNLTVPDAYMDRIENSINYISDPERPNTVVTVKISGDTTGLLLFLFPEDHGNKLACIMNGGEEMSAVLTSNDLSALGEVGNILSGNFLTALSNFLGIIIIHSISKVATDPLNTILESVIAESNQGKSFVSLIFKIGMDIEDVNIETRMFFLMDPEFTNKMLELAKKKIS